MAEFAAHLNQSSSANQDGPSIFEVIAANSLSASLKPAYEHCIRILTSRYPATIGSWGRLKDSFYYCVLGAIEWNHLSHYDASFAEYFYGLVRKNAKDGSSLTTTKRLYSLLELVGVPAMEDCVNSWYMHVKEENATGVLKLRNDFAAKLRKLFYQLYPFIHLIHRLYRVVLYFRYCFRMTEHPCLSFQLLQLKYQYLKPGDLTSQEVLLGKGLFNLLKSLVGKVFQGVTLALPVLIFFIKFLEWWYSQDVDSHRAFSSLPVPPPPRLKSDDPKRNQCAGPSHCPICRREQRTPSLLTTSGVMYCYACIHEYVSQSGCCAVTRLPSTLENIVRVYIE